ncbi:MAG: hypothetical protein K0R28_3652 [Paenibacillus sp.]|jgi:MFS superfamily sulfate permease-like transporter|nr:hypothetical protein [Paenibacillus sp.]
MNTKPPTIVSGCMAGAAFVIGLSGCKSSEEMETPAQYV